MHQLSFDDRKSVDLFLKVHRHQTFYHYFPLIYALSESTSKLSLDGCYLIVDEDTLLFDSGIYVPSEYNKVLISERLPPLGFDYSIYDNNFIYDLATTIQIKNFRGNFNDFLKRNEVNYISVETDEHIQMALEVVKEWYSKSKRKEFGDFGYTLWLTENSRLFSDLKARLVMAKSKPIGYTLFGKIRDSIAVHIVSKDLGWTFLQDYMRMMAYREMLAHGFTEVNDGSSVGEEGIYHYKLKLRPKYIEGLPLFSPHFIYVIPATEFDCNSHRFCTFPQVEIVHWRKIEN